MVLKLCVSKDFVRFLEVHVYVANSVSKSGPHQVCNFISGIAVTIQVVGLSLRFNMLRLVTFAV